MYIKKKGTSRLTGNDGIKFIKFSYIARGDIWIFTSLFSRKQAIGESWRSSG